MPFHLNFETNQLNAFLKEASFPASPEQLEEQASARNLSSSVLAILQSLPSRMFESASDVTRTLQRHAA